MGDFYQNGSFATLHQIGDIDLERLERRIAKDVEKNPVSLILCSTFDDIQGEAFPRITNELMSVGYLTRIVVVLEGATRAEMKKAGDYYAVLPQETKLICMSGSGVKKVLGRLAEAGFVNPRRPSKGLGVWLAMGYLMGCGDTRVIAVHDSDIISYDRTLLARLVYPLVNFGMRYEYSKGYYVRVSNRMHGRVTRLFVAPLVRSLGILLGDVDFLNYLAAFRYPLSSEFAIRCSLARRCPVPSDFALEMGLLGEVYRHTDRRRICQVDLSIDYEHAHMTISDEDTRTGLVKMCADIAGAVFVSLAQEGIDLTDSLFRSLRLAYRKNAHEYIALYEADADINVLEYDRHGEVRAVDTFIRGLDLAIDLFGKGPGRTATTCPG